MSDNDTFTGGTERPLRQRIKLWWNGHDWRYYWSTRRKKCHLTGEVQDIELEYRHQDETAEIGDERYVIKEESEICRIEKQRYKNTARAEDYAYFQWSYVRGFEIEENDLAGLRHKIDRFLKTDTDRSDGGDET